MLITFRHNLYKIFSFDFCISFRPPNDTDHCILYVSCKCSGSFVVYYCKIILINHGDDNLLHFNFQELKRFLWSLKLFMNLLRPNTTCCEPTQIESPWAYAGFESCSDTSLKNMNKFQISLISDNQGVLLQRIKYTKLELIRIIS